MCILWHLWGKACEIKKISLHTGGIRFLRRFFPSPFVLDGDEVTPEQDSPEEETSGKKTKNYFYSDYKNKEPRKPQSNHPKVISI